MKLCAFAIGLTTALLSMSATYADHRAPFYNAEDGRPAYESDRVTANTHRLENVQGVKPFADVSQKRTTPSR